MKFMDWVRRFNDREQRQVAVTRLDAARFISTIWLGLNHSWDDGPPLIFETMGFGRRDTFLQRRYATIEEARAGHAEAVREHGGRNMERKKGGYYTRTGRIPEEGAFGPRHLEVLGWIKQLGGQQWLAVAWATPKGGHQRELGVFRSKRNALAALRKSG